MPDRCGYFSGKIPPGCSKLMEEYEDALCRLRCVERHAVAMERLICDLLDVWQPEWGKGSLHDRAIALVGPLDERQDKPPETRPSR